MTENMKKLMEKVSASEDLRAKFNELGKQAGEVSDKAKELLIAFAQEQGITLTEEDFNFDGEELSEDELCAVAGGRNCGCFLFGAGEAWGGLNMCCIFAGTDEAKCLCPIVGGGGK